MRPALAPILLIVMMGPATSQNSGLQMQTFSNKVHICINIEAVAVAPKPVDLETATVAVMARCAKPLLAMRNFLYTGIPNFTPNQDFWEKDIEPVWIKEARNAVAVVRTRDAPAAPQQKTAPAPRPNGKDQI